MHKRLLTVSLIGALLLALPMAGFAASSLSIFMTGLNLTYDGTNIMSRDAGNGDYIGADDLITAQFVVNEALVGTSVATYADVFIGGVFGLMTTGTSTVNSQLGHGFDLFFDDLGGFLDLDWDTPVEISLNNILGELSIHGSAVTSDIGGQALPFGLEIGTPVEVTFSQQITSFETGFPGAPVGLMGVAPNLIDDTHIMSFQSFGTGEITGPNAVPEPTTLILVGAGLAGGFLRRRRRS